MSPFHAPNRTKNQVLGFTFSSNSMFFPLPSWFVKDEISFLSPPHLQPHLL